MAPVDWNDVRALSADPAPAATPTASIGDLLDGLNPPQREAVTHSEGPLVILAGPGSGKTRVITRRIAWLITEAGVEPWRILAITFTNKAAREMRERVEALLPATGLWIGTFHAMCTRILRREIEVLGAWTRDFTIYDTHDRNQLLKSLIKEANVDATRFKPAAVGGWISKWKNLDCVRTIETAAPEPAALAAGELEPVEFGILADLRRRYQAALQKHNALDFDDLLLKVLEIFEREPGIRDAYANRFRYVMVDEYQDTNRVQYLLTRHFASVHKNLAVCGDPDQSIYAWRGADVRNILDFEADFPDAKVVRLEQNYRSTGNILRAAQGLIEKNRARVRKQIWTEAAAGEPLVGMRCADENDEARWIAERIHGLQIEGRALGEIAIFYRVNFMQRALETALRLASIPYRIVAGVEFYERREIRDLIAYLKLCVNPQDDIAFRRAVNTPARGIGEKSLESLAAWAADRRLPLWEAARSSEALRQIRGRARAGLEAFAELIGRLHALRDGPASRAIDQVLAEIDYAAWLAEIDDHSGVDREANVEELRAQAREYDRGETLVARQRRAEMRARGIESEEMPTLRGFLQEIALVSDADGGADEGGLVTLMTLHSAKGLEFPVVFIAGIEEELLPHVRAVFDTAGEDGEAGVEEERRLFYVGLTRARERLFLSWAHARGQFGQLNIRQPSRFLAEIEPDLLEGEQPASRDEDVLGQYEPSSAVPDLAVGDRVEHDHFGRGTVERLQGSGVNARATVHFPAQGEKQLLLIYAKLRVIGRAAR